MAQSSTTHEAISKLCASISSINQVSMHILDGAANYQPPQNARAVSQKDVNYAVDEISTVNQINSRDLSTLAAVAGPHALQKMSETELASSLRDLKSRQAAQNIEQHARDNNLNLFELLKVVSREEKLAPVVNIDTALRLPEASMARNLRNAAKDAVGTPAVFVAQTAEKSGQVLA